MPPELGRRGGGWVLIQFALLALVVGAQLVGPVGSGWWALPFLLAGVMLFTASARALGPALTPFPRPREGVVRTTRGPYRRLRHPMYVAVLLLCVAASVRHPLAWAPTAVLALVLAAKARLESGYLDESN